MTSAKHITIELIQQVLQGKLPGIEAQKNMLPEGRTLILPGKDTKQSAVLLLLFSVKNELHFCLTQRNSALKHHPGQISFPGGRCEKHETNPYETALRETYEEIGVSPNAIQLLGKLTDLYVSVSNFNIHPYVGWCSEIPEFHLNTTEVEELIVLPLSSIFNPENKSTYTIDTNIGVLTVPCYRINGHVIWGATSMMIAELEAILKPHYFHREAHLSNADNGLKC